MKNRRRKKLNDRKVQGQLLIGIAAHWSLYFMLLLFCIPMWHMLTVSGFSKPLPTVLVDSLSQMLPVLVFLVAVLPIFVWEMIRLSHRFTGPMYRLHTAIRSINAGKKFQPIHFRKDDFWHEIADDFNTMMKRFAEEQGSESAQAPDTEQSPLEKDSLALT